MRREGLHRADLADHGGRQVARELCRIAFQRVNVRKLAAQDGEQFGIQVDRDEPIRRHASGEEAAGDGAGTATEFHYELVGSAAHLLGDQPAQRLGRRRQRSEPGRMLQEAAEVDPVGDLPPREGTLCHSSGFKGHLPNMQIYAAGNRDSPKKSSPGQKIQQFCVQLRAACRHHAPV